MYTALLENGAIPDPLYEDNDVLLAWVGYYNWTYRRTFESKTEITKFILFFPVSMYVCDKILIILYICKCFDVFLTCTFFLSITCKNFFGTFSIFFEGTGDYDLLLTFPVYLCVTVNTVPFVVNFVEL